MRVDADVVVLEGTDFVVVFCTACAVCKSGSHGAARALSSTRWDALGALQALTPVATIQCAEPVKQAKSITTATRPRHVHLALLGSTGWQRIKVMASAAYSARQDVLTWT